MAGTPVPEESPKFGLKATVAALIFAVAVLGGFSAATAVSYEDDKGHDDHGEEHGEDHSDDEHDENHADEGEEHSE